MATPVVGSQASRISPRVRACVRLISGRGKGRKNMSGHSRKVFWLPIEKWVDQSGAGCHVIMRNFHVSMYSSICTSIV